MHNSSMDHLESVKPFPQYYTVNAPIAVGIGVSRLQARTSAAWRDREVCVVHTGRGAARRIISARKATRKEREEFHAYLTEAIG